MGGPTWKLREAAERGSVNTLGAEIKKGINLHGGAETGFTALHKAVGEEPALKRSARCPTANPPPFGGPAERGPRAPVPPPVPLCLRAVSRGHPRTPMYIPGYPSNRS